MKITDSQERHLRAATATGFTAHAGSDMGYNRGVVRRLVERGLLEIVSEHAKYHKYGTIEFRTTKLGMEAISYDEEGA